MTGDTVEYQVSPVVDNSDLNTLFHAAWPRHDERDFSPVLRHSLAWVCAYRSGHLIGFVNLAWDGGYHGFILDTTVHPDVRRHGIGQHLVHEAVTIAWERGLHWVHVDYEPHLHEFYDACGFHPAPAGLIDLRLSGDQPS